MRTLAPPVGRGWEYMTGPAAAGELGPRTPSWPLPELLAEKPQAPWVEAGTTTW